MNNYGVRLGVDPKDNLFSSIVCYADLRERGDLVENYIEEVMELAGPYLSAINFIKLIIDFKGTRIRPQKKSFIRQTWQQVKEYLRNGDVTVVAIYADNPHYLTIFQLAVDYQLELGGLPNLEYAIYKDYVGSTFPPEYLQTNLEIVKGYTDKLQAAGSYITIDTIWPATRTLSPHER